LPAHRHLLASTDPTTNLIPVKTRLVRTLLAFVCLAGATIHASAEDAKPATPPPAPKEEVMVLPKLEVTAQRAKQIDKELKRVDKMIAREKKKIKSTELDKALNNEKLSRAAAIFGGNSAEHLSAVAATHVMLLEQERMVLEAMKRPATLEERKLMQAELDQIRLTRRNLDDPSKQR
jgi:hypothetical protein